jgi:hypothetical protein
MEGVTATMSELGGRLAALAPAARTVADGIGGPLTWVAALVYGVGRALGLRRAARPWALRRRAVRPPAGDARLRPGWRGVALTGERPGSRRRGKAPATKSQGPQALGGSGGSLPRADRALTGRPDGTSS